MGQENRSSREDSLEHFEKLFRRRKATNSPEIQDLLEINATAIERLLDMATLFERSPLTYFIWDTVDDTWKVMDVSKNIFTNFGYSPKEFLSWEKQFSDIIHPDDLLRVREEVRQYITKERRASFVQKYRIFHANGEIRHISDTTEVEYNPDGYATKVYGSIKDITEKLRAEALKNSYMKALDNSAIVQIVDTNGIIQYVNDIYREISGDRRNIIGENARVMGGWEYHSKEFWKDVWDTILSGNVWQWVMENPKRQTGGTYYTETTITPIRDESGKITHFIAVKFDITPRKKLEQKLYDITIKDGLTEIYNRRFFDEKMEIYCKELQENGEKELALALIDIDLFKRINDGFGHPVGDAVIKNLAYRLLSLSPRGFEIFRIGGEEFAIIGHGKSIQEMVAAIEGIRQEIHDSHLSIDDHIVHYTISAGITGHTRKDIKIEPLRLFNSADALLYYAKNSGRNTVKTSLDI